ncbi:MAG: hypothetical protein R2724_10960 [Bryobacterales bacterium]
MPIVDSPIILACVVIYLAACFVVGVWAMGRTHSIADFLVAGQSLGPFVVVIAMMSSIMSGFGFVGGPGLVFDSGMSSAWMTLVALFGAAMSWTLLGKRLRLLSEAREILTLPDAVAARYGGHAPRLMVGIAIFLGVIGYLGTQVMAVGYVLTAVLGVDMVTAMAIGLGVLAFYSVAGGIIAGVYTDMFQGVIMMVAAVCVCYYAIASAGGMSAMSEVLWDWDPHFIGAWGTRGSTTALSWYLVFAWSRRPAPRGDEVPDAQRHPHDALGTAVHRADLRADQLALVEYRAGDARPAVARRAGAARAARSGSAHVPAQPRAGVARRHRLRRACWRQSCQQQTASSTSARRRWCATFRRLCSDALCGASFSGPASRRLPC